MLISNKNLLKARVSTFLGSIFLISWATGCGMLMWHASFDTDPISSSFAKVLYAETYDTF